MNERTIDDKLARAVRDGYLTIREAMGLAITVRVAKQAPAMICTAFGTYGAEIVHDLVTDEEARRLEQQQAAGDVRPG